MGESGSRIFSSTPEKELRQAYTEALRNSECRQDGEVVPSPVVPQTHQYIITQRPDYSIPPESQSWFL
jgi:hypothetical protein